MGSPRVKVVFGKAMVRVLGPCEPQQQKRVGLVVEVS
jgi:hypothetical protein